MAVDDILKKIKADADEAERRILDEARKAAEAVAGEARAKTDAQRARMSARAKQHADEERNRIVTLAKLTARRDLLTEKQRLIDRVFDETRRSIVSMERAAYQALIARFLREAVEPGDSEIILDVDETRIDQAFLDRVAGERGPGALKLSDERRPIGAGFVLRRGRTETNCALDTILRDARDRLETEVAKILFGDGGS
jgi:V/A-type H+-transporting ATPase subunit E